MEAGRSSERDWLVGVLEATVRNELVHQRIVLDLSMSVIDIQAITKGIVAEVLARFPVGMPEWSDLRDVDQQ